MGTPCFFKQKSLIKTVHSTFDGRTRHGGRPRRSSEPVYVLKCASKFCPGG